MALKRVWIASPNYSSRGGSSVKTIVCHTAEGATTYQSLGNFFSSSSAGVSSHVGIDDTPGTIGEYVSRGNKAWTQGNANPWCVSVELCAFAAWTTAEWDRHPNMLSNVAAWIAEEAAHFGIPITKLSASQAQSGASGVCDHAALGSMGGGHWDCGSGFPMDRVLNMARGGAGAPAAPGAPAVGYDPLAGREGQTVAANHDGRLEVFNIKGAEIEHRWQDKPGGAWHASWSSLGQPNPGVGQPNQGVNVSDVSVIANKDGRLEVFSLLDSGRVKNRWQDKPGGAWHPDWGDLGVINTGRQITASMHKDGRLGLFVTAANGDVWTREQRDPGSGWDNWYNLRGSN